MQKYTWEVWRKLETALQLHVTGSQPILRTDPNTEQQLHSRAIKELFILPL